jgi:hypothetical protein
MSLVQNEGVTLTVTPFYFQNSSKYAIRLPEKNTIKEVIPSYRLIQP